MITDVPSDVLDRTLREFRCTRDKDIESFLQTKAITYETRGWCSTYLQINSQQFFEQQSILVDGYFTLSNKVLHLADSVSNRTKKKVFGGLKKQDSHAHFILIGQLGKYISEGNVGKTSAKKLLDKAFGIIYQVKRRIACNCVLIECKDDPKIRSIYEDYGFQELQQDCDSVKYFKILQ